MAQFSKIKELKHSMKIENLKLKIGHQSGFSTLEMLISLVVMTLTLTAVILVTFSNQSTSVSSQTNDEAIAKAQEQIESIRALARQDINLAQGCDDSSATKCSGTVDPYYNRKIIVSDIDSFSKNVTSQVTWSTGSSNPQQVELKTIVTNWSSVAGSNNCDPNLSGDWKHPQLLGHADFQGSAGGTDIDVTGKKAYITSDPTSSGQEDFYIYDISDSNNPVQLGKKNTGPGLAAIRVIGKYAYVADISTVAQLQVLDISTPGTPTIVASLDVTAAGDTAVGNSIFYANKKIYLGLTKSSGPEFHVIDVSDPLHPVNKATFETNTKISAISIKNGIAYLAVPDNPSSATPEQLRILDVNQADTGTITQLNTFSAPNPALMSGEGFYLSPDGKTLYFGRSEGGANPSHNPEFFVLDVNDPAGINNLGSRYTGSTINAITVRGGLAFLITGDLSLGFQIWDISNPANMVLYSSLNLQQTSTGGMDCEGNIFYIAQTGSHALQIIGPTPN